MSTARSVNHQSQLRVPPNPPTGPRPSLSVRGKFKPELSSAVVFPAPGEPMIAYQGNSYRYERPNRQAPREAKRALFNSDSAVEKRRRSTCASDESPGSAAGVSPATTRSLFRLA